MIPAIRQQTILELLKKADSILYLDDLQTQLEVSSSTLRRDLRELELKGSVSLLHGGGVQLATNTAELDIAAKLSLNKEAKMRIASAAAQTIQEGDVIFIDPSSTTLEIIPYLVNRHVTVVTNGIYHINQLVANRIPSTMVGGNIKQATNSCIGPMAEKAMRTYHFSKCFLGSNGFSKATGITNHDINECLIKQIAIENSLQSYFLLDSSKYNVITMVKVIELSVPTIFTDKVYTDLKEYSNIIVV